MDSRGANGAHFSACSILKYLSINKDLNSSLNSYFLIHPESQFGERSDRSDLHICGLQAARRAIVGVSATSPIIHIMRLVSESDTRLRRASVSTNVLLERGLHSAGISPFFVFICAQLPQMQACSNQTRNVVGLQ